MAKKKVYERRVNKDAYLETKVVQLRKMYRTTQRELTSRLAQVSLTKFQRYRTESTLKEVTQIIRALDIKCVKWAKQVAKEGYAEGFDIASALLKEQNVVRFTTMDTQIHTSAVDVLTNEITADILTTNSGMKQKLVRFIRMSQQRVLEEKQINNLIAQGLIEGSTRRTTSDVLYQQMVDRMGKQQFITINGRNYRPDRYAEMLARTRTREAVTRGTINTALHYGVDTVKISYHASSCTYCHPFEGKVYSISGRSKEYPMLKERPPFHPNCKHILLPHIPIEGEDE